MYTVQYVTEKKFVRHDLFNLIYIYVTQKMYFFLSGRIFLNLVNTYIKQKNFFPFGRVHTYC